MMPRYQAREASPLVNVPHPYLDLHPWCVVEHTAHGPRVAAYCDTIEDANSHAVRLNVAAEGLRRLGVAVAVWGAMAAVQGLGVYNPHGIVGLNGQRDPNYPCDSFIEGLPGGFCNGDGHYLCRSCKAFAGPRGVLP